jgi:histidinol-phosphatase (PHP family)
VKYKNNYHTHTFRCGHAGNYADEEYVLAAINNGFETLGFSDHIMLPGVFQSGIRGDYSLLDDYVKSINCLKEKYHNQIKIHLGFEAEALPDFYDYYRDLLSNKKIEYLILGNHSYFENNQMTSYFMDSSKMYEDLEKYTSLLIDAMATGLFKYVAHPDLFMKYFKIWDDSLIDATNRICDASIKYNIPLEINLACCFDRVPNIGIKDVFKYPYIEFWKIVSKKECKVIIGIDAHKPSRFNRAQEVVDYTLSALDLNLNIIDKIEVEK